MIFISKSFRTIVFIFWVIFFFYLTSLIIGCEKKNKDEDNSPKTLTDKNHQALSQKFRQLINSWSETM